SQPSKTIRPSPTRRSSDLGGLALRLEVHRHRAGAMKVLLDVCTPKQVREALPAHEVETAVKMSWGELENGDLLRQAEAAGFDLRSEEHTSELQSCGHLVCR